MFPVSVKTAAFVRRPLVMSMMMPLFLPSRIIRWMGAELGATIASTLFIAR